MRHVLALVLAAALLPACGAAASTPGSPSRPAGPPPSSDARTASVDRELGRLVRPGSPGCSVAVAREGEVILARGYGLADIEHDAPITAATSFHVASISKQFTAAAILLLAGEGRLSLDDDVRRFVPEVPAFGGARITVRHLLHHTSGLRDQWALLRMSGVRPDDVITQDDVLDLVRRQEDLNFPPGAEFNYSNTNYTLLAEIVHRVSGKPFAEFAAERILRPLGLSGTHVQADHTRLVPGRANGYERGRDGAFHLHNPPFDTFGATSLHATASDLVRWIEALSTGRLGGARLAAAMVERGRLADGTVLPYAAGLVDDAYRGLAVVEHGGGDAGFRAHVMRFPTERYAFAVLCNRADVHPQAIAQRLADVYLEGRLGRRPSAPPGGADPALAGLYFNAPREELARVEARDGKLFASGAPLAPLGGGRYRWSNAEVAFRAAGDRFLLERTVQGARPVVFERLGPFAAAPADLADAAGVYESPELGVRYTIDAGRGAAIRVRPPRIPERAFTAFAPDLLRDDDGAVLHVVREGGRVVGFTLTTGRVRRLRFVRR